MNSEVGILFELHQNIIVGDISKTRSLIGNLCIDERRNLTRAYQRYGKKPAIFVAIERNNREFVEFLVNECCADIEEQLSNENPIGQVSPSPMSPLEFAYFTEQYTIFELLLIYGGDPTRLLNDRKSIVRICRYELLSLQSLQILANHGAAFNTSDDDGFTCLMQTVRRPHLSQFLLNTGVDVNLKNKDGDTALHLAVKCRCSGTVKLLLRYGADPCSKNKDEYSPLHLACIYRFEEILGIMLEAVEDKTRHVESYQLFGACSDNFIGAMIAWRKAMKVSSMIPNQTSPVALSTPFGIAVEATSFSELDVLIWNRDMSLMQSVVINYKIFGPNHDRFFKSIEISANMFYEWDSVEKWLQMLSFWLRMLCDSSLTEARKCPQLKHIFSEIHLVVINPIETTVAINYGPMFEFVETVIQVLRKCTDYAAKELLFNFLSRFFLGAFKADQTFYRVVRSAVEAIGECCQRTVLIDVLCHWFKERVNSSKVLTGVSILVDCGADVDEKDQDGNNTVHFLLECLTCPINRLKLTVAKQIAAKFVEHGIHLDSRNRRGMTTAKCLQKLGINITPPVNLMCLAARVIRQHKIPVQGILPKILVDFVEMH